MYYYRKFDNEEPVIMVGIGSFTEAVITTSDGKKIRAYLSEYKITMETEYNGSTETKTANGFYLCGGRDNDDFYFEIPDVEIGRGFHWSRKETQRFKGDLMLKKIDDKILIINYINIETYLISVISSEMSGNCPKEFLKAHAVISRSWALNQIDKIPLGYTPYISDYETKTWYDNGVHKYFDVCADDHCQRYQGITRAVNPEVRAAVLETAGEVLTYNGAICDARFSKCCGGATELFENCWQPVHFDYLEKIDDAEKNFTDNLTVEENAVRFIKSSPEAYCNTSDKKILSKILNSYDNEFSGFYRWKVFYTFDELSEIVKEKSGEDYGQITGLVPLQRGTSGRIFRLQIIGTKKTKIVGKELEIRRILSKSHLYSSAFTVEKDEKGFTLYGAGWGHGVGLCQIGAAVMAEEGKNYGEILKHYYKKAELEKIYERNEWK